MVLTFAHVEVAGDDASLARLALVQRVAARLPYLSSETAAHLSRDFAWWDRARRSHYGRGWARRLVSELQRLLNGELNAERWFQQMRAYAPKPAIVV